MTASGKVTHKKVNNMLFKQKNLFWQLNNIDHDPRVVYKINKRNSPLSEGTWCCALSGNEPMWLINE